MNTEEIHRVGLGRSLFRLTWPMIFGVLALMSYQLVDAFWIARLGVEPLAALGFTVPVQQFVIGFQVGLGIATTAIISRLLGSGDPDNARRQGGLVVVLGATAAAVLVFILWLLHPVFLPLMGAEPDIMSLIAGYWRIWLVAAWLGALVYFGYSLHRAQGDTRFPGLMMVITSVINMVLDPLFIFTFGLGLQGAALATVTAFGFGVLITYPRLLRFGWLSFDFRGIHLPRAIKDLVSIGGPAMVSQLMPPVSASLATGLVAVFGSAAVAAWGLGVRLEFFSIVVVLALTMAMPPLVGRLVGAGDLASARQLIRLAVCFVIVWQLAVAALWMALSGVMVPVVTDDAEVSGILQTYLTRVPLSFPGLGVCMLMVSVSNALGMPLRALLISILRLFACYLPSIWLGAQLGGMPGLLTGAALGNLLAGLVSWSLYRRGMRRLEARSPDSEQVSHRGA